jgi:drug/metabolite transporter (DMT)-like permease
VAGLGSGVGACSTAAEAMGGWEAGDAMPISLVFAVIATVLNSTAGLMQSNATRHVTPRKLLAAQPWYIAGLAVDGCGWVCTVLALRHLPVYVVQAVQGAAIGLTAIGARAVWGSTLRAIDRWAIGGCVIGLVVVSASAGAERPAITVWVSILVLVVMCVVLVVALVALRSSGRAWPLAMIAGLGFGGTSLAVRALELPAGRGVVAVLLAQPAAYLVVVFWIIGLIAYSRALELTSLAQVTAVMLVTEVIAPGLIGIALLGDSVRAGWWWPMLTGLGLAVAGIATLASSPTQQPPPRMIHYRHTTI